MLYIILNYLFIFKNQIKMEDSKDSEIREELLEKLGVAEVLHLINIIIYKNDKNNYILININLYISS